MRAAITILYVWIACSVAFAEPVEWAVDDGGNGHFYEALKLVDNRPTYWIDLVVETSNSAYSGMDGHMATITSAAEEAWLVEHVMAPQGVSKVYYLGAWIMEPGDETVPWQWITGEMWSYYNWADGEPNSQQQQVVRVLSYLYAWRGSGGSSGFNDTSAYTPVDPDDWWYIVEYDQLEILSLPPGSPVPSVEESWGSVKAMFR